MKYNFTSTQPPPPAPPGEKLEPEIFEHSIKKQKNDDVSHEPSNIMACCMCALKAYLL